MIKELFCKMTYKEFVIAYSVGAFDENALIKIAKTSKDKKILKVLSKNENWYVRGNIAWNSNTPKETLEYLSKDSNSNVRSDVAFNSNTPIKVLELLSKDKDYNVRDSAICTLGVLDEDTLIELSKKSKSKKILKVLSKNKNWYVSGNIACNSNTPIEVLELLSKDKNYSAGGGL